MWSDRSHLVRVAALSALALSACATPPAPGGGSGAAAETLACPLATNCVNSLGTGGLAPLRHAGTAEQALARLEATLATFAEAKVIQRQPLALEVIFTTPLGFRDQVDFRVDAAGGRIDFRSRSLFGWFDWGKNRSRMQEFAARYERPTGR